MSTELVKLADGVAFLIESVERLGKVATAERLKTALLATEGEHPSTRRAMLRKLQSRAEGIVSVLETYQDLDTCPQCGYLLIGGPPCRYAACGMDAEQRTATYRQHLEDTYADAEDVRRAMERERVAREAKAARKQAKGTM